MSFSGQELYKENSNWGKLVIGITFLPFCYTLAEALTYWMLVDVIWKRMFRRKMGVLATRGYRFTAKKLMYCFFELPMVRAAR